MTRPRTAASLAGEDMKDLESGPKREKYIVPFFSISGGQILYKFGWGHYLGDMD